MVKAQVLQEQGKTQREIAEALGVTDRTVRNYLRGKGIGGKRKGRRSKLDAFKELIDSLIDEDPFRNRELLLERLQKQMATRAASRSFGTTLPRWRSG